MKKIYLLFLLIGCTKLVSAQTYTPEEAAKHVGDSIQVCGKVFGGRFFETSNGSPTLLNMGSAFPSSPITIMIPGAVRAKLGYVPEAELKDKNICVRGRVTLFRERPEIVVYDVSQLQVKN